MAVLPVFYDRLKNFQDFYLQNYNILEEKI